MSESFGDKFKGFFGLGNVDPYTDSYYQDDLDDNNDRYSRQDRDGTRGRHDDHASTRGSYGRYRGSDAGSDYGIEPAERGGRYGESTPSRSASAAPATPAVQTPVKREPIAVRLALTDYSQAKELAETLKTGDVVVFNLGGMEKSLATRVIDFAAGLSFGLDAELKKLNGIRNFVLIPQGVSLDQSQLDQLAEG